MHAFNSKLSGEEITVEGYEHVKKVWKKFQCKNLLDYSILYLLMDVGLLADIYLSWRNAAYEQFGLDPVHYLTSTSLSLDAFLHSSKVRLPLISDGELYQLITSNIRGGFCSLVNRHAIASNPHVNPHLKDKNSRDKFILYVDFTSLYPNTMVEYKMPLDEITELAPPELEEFIGRDITTIDSQGEYGYFILLDTKKVRDDVARDTDAFPLALHHMNIGDEHTLMKLGLEIECIKKVYKFRQDTYLRDYIMKNAAQRAKESDPDKRNTIKILMNGLFGVTIKNSLNYANRNVVVTNEASLFRNVSKHTYKSLDMINEERFIINHNRETVLADSPIYIGFSVLDLAKDKMYERITKTGKGNLGLVKIETGAEYIKEFIGVKPKVYSYLTETKRCNTLKGVQRSKQKSISHDQYKDVVDENEITYTELYNLQNIKGTMCLTKQKKTALCPLEDKRFYVDAYNSYAYGHPDIEAVTPRRQRYEVITPDNVDEGEELEVEEGEEEEMSNPFNRDTTPSAPAM
ncbi:uncharacterized protein LOC135208136 [Macrobrachium nipponense]|uniref:uncharacterized protein LOC135208136 n=1 Tax=Macrobrachium nipponense TaxID=159736 RepID=UPI0030C7C40E